VVHASSDAVMAHALKNDWDVITTMIVAMVLMKLTVVSIGYMHRLLYPHSC